MAVFLRFLKSYWQQSLLLIVGVLAALWVQGLIHARDVAVSEAASANRALAAMVTSLEAQMQQQKADSARKEKAFKQVNAKAAAEYAEQLTTLRIETQKDRKKITEQLEAYRRENVLNKHRLAAANQRLSLYRAVENRSGASPAAQTTNQTQHPTTAQKCDRVSAYASTLERGCAITTADFNRCSQWVEDVCSVYGCGE